MRPPVDVDRSYRVGEHRARRLRRGPDLFVRRLTGVKGPASSTGPTGSTEATGSTGASGGEPSASSGQPAANGRRILGALLLTGGLLLASCQSDTDGADGAADGPDDAEQGAPARAEDGEVVDPVTVSGPEPDAVLGAAALAELTFTVTDPRGIDDLVVLLGDEDVTAEAQGTGNTLRYVPDGLTDGLHEVHIARRIAPAEAGGGGADSEGVGDEARDSEGLGNEARGGEGAGSEVGGAETDPGGDPDHLDVLGSWRFEVKTTPPPLELTAPEGPLVGDGPTTITGHSEPGATIAVGDTSVPTDTDGSFALEVWGLTGDHEVVATDRAGNTTTVARSLAWVPSRVVVDELRTVHVSFNHWRDPEIREPLLALIDAGTLTAIQLDLKDESGQVGWDSGVAVADEAGATTGAMDLAAAVAELHARDVAVVGRIVAFADPVLSAWAWEQDRRDWVIQLPDGSAPFRGSYAGFTNFTHPEVVDYLLDLAEAAAAVGVDHILWDYIRRPEGFSRYVVPGLETTPEEAIAEFTRLADERLAPYGIEHGASVYGIAADRPWEIGQDIRAMAPYLDYVAPMIYPSHWGPGEYGVADPNRQPYDIIRATLAVWQDTVDGSRARVVPWLEDTPYRAWDRPFQVREQWRGTRDAGIDEWLMWNAASRYSLAVYAPW